ncbi:MAG: hypothetical protein C0483_26225 [Pirellula sp.]|nr:hypothetical protein [Pirellula sp.]
MQPLIHLKSFLAVLVILIVPAALLVAYFRNYSSTGGGHDHGEMGKSGAMSAMKPDEDGHAAMGHGAMPESQSGQMQKQAGTSPSPVAQLEKEEGHAGMEHGNMAQSAVGQSPPRSESVPEQTGAVETHEPLDMAETSALPGIPGLSRLYHIGATGFFLNHSEHIAPTLKQQAALNRLQQQSLLNKSTAQRKIDEAEQELWELTGADEPEVAQIQAQVEAIEKLRGDQRMAFIRSVGEAVKVLTDEQRRAILGTMAPNDHRHSPANK